MASTRLLVVGVGTPVTARGPRPCSPRSARSRPKCLATVWPRPIPNRSARKPDGYRRRARSLTPSVNHRQNIAAGLRSLARALVSSFAVSGRAKVFGAAVFPGRFSSPALESGCASCPLGHARVHVRSIVSTAARSWRVRVVPHDAISGHPLTGQPFVVARRGRHGCPESSCREGERRSRRGIVWRSVRSVAFRRPT